MAAMNLKSIVLLLCMIALAIPAPVTIANAQDDARLEVAQNQQRPRSLFEALFGSQNQNNQPQPQAQPRQQPQTTSQPRRQPQPQPQAQPRQQPRAQPAPAPTPVVSTVGKNEDATRIAVFGDSLSIDLARAIDRFYAEDPETMVIGMGVGSSGFVRDDFHDWNRTLERAIANDSFDIAVVMIGINDRQALAGANPLSEPWRAAYAERITRFMSDLREAGKPGIWVELPPMERQSFSADMAQIASIHRQVVQASGGEWVETYERFLGEDGNYSAMGPDINGQVVPMRKGDGIHLSAEGADKVAFYIDRALGAYHQGGGSSFEVADPLAGTDAAAMMRPPFQGLGQTQQLAIAGAVRDLSASSRRATDLLIAQTQSPASATSSRGFDLDALVTAPQGRADAFGVGVAPAQEPTQPLRPAR